MLQKKYCALSVVKVVKNRKMIDNLNSYPSWEGIKKTEEIIMTYLTR